MYTLIKHNLKCSVFRCRVVGVERYVFFRADADTDYYRSSRYVSGVKMKMNAKINNNKSSDKKRSLNAFKHVFNSENC